jgi:hypothetical protein
MPSSASEIVLGTGTAAGLHARVGSTIRLKGGTATESMTVTGLGFVPAGPHNDYPNGAWLTPAGYSRLFKGAHFAFKFHLALVQVAAGTSVTAAAAQLNGAAVGVAGGGAGHLFTPPEPLSQVQEVKDVSVLPLALSAFLALLAVGAIGHALAVAVNRRRHELAVLRALGLTRFQSRMVVVTHASLLGVIGLALGIPLGIALGRGIWHVAADFTPLAYHPPAADLALLLIIPATLLAANLLALWPGHRAAGLRPGHILRTE